MKSTMIKKYGVSYYLLFLLLPVLFSCNKILNIDPPKENISAEIVFSNDLVAVSAMAGIYSSLISSIAFSGGGDAGIAALGGLSSDELVFNTLRWPGRTDYIQFYQNELQADNILIESLWGSIYNSIYGANAMIEGLEGSTAISTPVKKQLRGEALFIRAFCYFYAVNLFNDVPLLLTTDYQANQKASRTAFSTVYGQMVRDLIEAKELLSEEYVEGTSQAAPDRVRVNKFAAAALLSRVYLYQRDWVGAEAQATIVLNNTLYDLDTSLSQVFLASTAAGAAANKEVIWQLMPVTFNANMAPNEGNTFILYTGNDGSYFFRLSDSLRKSFEPGDERYSKWAGVYVEGTGDSLWFPYKYKLKNTDTGRTEYSMVLRVAELYLIRAEARAERGNVSGAQSDINAIRHRAKLGNTSAGDKDALLAAVEQERRVELFSEWGHRWLDLKRRKRADDVLGLVKAPHWQSNDTLYPLPAKEMRLDKQLTPQNTAY
jgi:hypothetical protein